MFLDDLNLVTGGPATSASVYGNQWRLDKSCPEVPSLGDVCFDEETRQKGIAACQILVDTNDIFGSCLQVVSQSFDL